MYQNNSIEATSFNKLRFNCVLIPVILALATIFSTNIATDVQSQIIFGLPAILWCWFTTAIISCASIFVAGLSAIKSLDNSTNE